MPGSTPVSPIPARPRCSIKGRMEAQRSVQGVRYIDGDASVESSYFMQPALVEPYR
jgi:hypothetical protein